MSLATKYRPQTFEDLLGQEHVKIILQKQLDTNTIKNTYLFCGPSGDGKTTIARILANRINKNQGQPIEIDAASNNGVDNIRSIIDDAKQRSIDSEYKIYIVDEAHMISQAGWNAFLKCIEEPPKYTIFMFCTTNPEKIPATIINRCMRFNLSKVSTELIKKRLEYISQKEGFTNYDEACDFIAKISNGGVRDAIANLEKCADYSNDLDINNVLAALGNYSYEEFFKLTNDLIDCQEGNVLENLNRFFNSGKDVKLFIDQYLEFVLDLTKYSIFKDIKVTKLPTSLEEQLKYATGIENAVSYFNKLVETVLDIKNMIKNDPSASLTIQAMFIKSMRG